MATVELARDAELARKVAVKRLSASLAGDPVFQKRFFREARMAASLSHPNLVAVYDVGEDDGVPYIVMEYVAGETLAEVIARNGALDAQRAVDLLLQVCAGLEHAHAAGLVHRDIKPQNLLLGADGVLKIADFGIARTPDATRLTQAGTVLGTAAYLAPEQVAGERVTAAADLYSVGAVAYELLTGRVPYEFESLVDLAVKQRRQPPPLEGVPRRLARAIMRCLAVEPDDRPRSAAALAQELAEVSPEPPTQPLPRSQVTAATGVLAAPRRTLHVSYRALLVALALVAAVLVAGGLGYAYLGGDDATTPREQPARVGVLPRGDTPAESARLLAEWLRARAG